MSSSGGGSSRTGRSRRSQLDQEVDEKMTQLRMQLLEEKLADEKRRAGRGKYREVTGHDIGDGAGAGQLEAEVEVAKLRHSELRHQLQREQELAERLADRQLQQRTPDSGSGRQQNAGGDRRQDRFTDMMEMMMVQNSQMHNMILNQMLLRQSQSGGQPPVSQQQPQPVFIPMPMYPPYQQPQQQQQQQPPERRTPRQPQTPKAEAKEAKAEERPATKVKKSHMPFPFPGNDSQQKLRRLAYAAFFLATLNRLTNENKFRPTNDFLFDLKLKEIMETLHRIYKAPDGQLYSITMATVMGEEADELTELMNVPKTLSRDEERAVSQELSYCVENTVFQVTDIMPTAGILGTHRKSGVFEMLRHGNLFPRGYFYAMEREMLEFTEDGRTARISDCDARMLLVGMFLVRALVETLYLRTEHYGMVDETTPKAERNIKLVASILVYLYRKVVGQLAVMDQGIKKAKASIPAVPQELADDLYTDAEIRPVLKLIKKSLDYAENLLLQWSEEYVKRLRESAF